MTRVAASVYQLVAHVNKCIALKLHLNEGTTVSLCSQLKQHMEEMTVKGEELVRTVEHNLTDGVSSLEKSACQDDHNW